MARPWLADTLDYIDTELPKMQRRAKAWAVGDVAALPIDQLLDPKGLLAQLRARGYTVEESQ